MIRRTLTRITSRWDNAYPRWAPNGDRILYLALDPGPGVVSKSADGTGVEEILFEGAPTRQFALNDVSSDGRNMLYTSRGDIFLLALDESPSSEVLIASEFDEANSAFSPDGRWVAYDSNESGRREVYVHPLRGSGGRTLVSTGGGQQPVWRGDGRELFYYGENGVHSLDTQFDRWRRASGSSHPQEQARLKDTGG